MTTNDAAERLRTVLAKYERERFWAEGTYGRDLDAALAEAREQGAKQERERIRAALLCANARNLRWWHRQRAAEYARMTSSPTAEEGEDAESNHPNAEWNR